MNHFRGKEHFVPWHTEIPIKKAFLLGLPRTATAATVKQSTPWFCLVPSSLLRKEKCTLDHSSRTPIFGHTSCSFFFKQAQWKPLLSLFSLVNQVFSQLFWHLKKGEILTCWGSTVVENQMEMSPFEFWSQNSNQLLSCIFGPNLWL